MKEYSGSVLFIDLLGFGYLTDNTDSVEADDFKAHRFKTGNGSNQLFAAYILAKFRKHLMLQRDLTQNIKVAQLSDCVFVWSENSDTVLEFSRAMMWSLALDGLLCRAGIAYGQIVEPEKPARSIGDYICGSAVTKAVKAENSGKGARVFVDVDFPSMCEINFPESFQPRISKVDYRIADEFCWYLYSSDIVKATPSLLKNKRTERCRSIIELLANYIHSPKYEWNARTRPGLTQIASTIDIITSSYNELEIGPNIPHTFEHIMVEQSARGRGKIKSYIMAMSKKL